MSRTPEPRHLMAGALAVILSVASAAMAQDRPGINLAEQRWQDRAYGLTMRPPVGWSTFRHTADVYLARFVDDRDRLELRIAVRQLNRPLDLEQIVDSFLKELQSTTPAIELFDPVKRRVDSYDAMVLYVQIPNVNNVTMRGHAFVAIAPQQYVTVELYGSRIDSHEIQALLPAILDTLTIADQQELARKRKAALDLGEAWLGSLTTKRLHDVLNKPKSYRMIQDAKDIGYMHVQESSTTVHGKRGVRIAVQWHMEVDGTQVGAKMQYFVADLDQSEIWQIATTRRAAPVAGQRDPRIERTIESGTRRGSVLTVRMEIDKGTRRNRADTPPPRDGTILRPEDPRARVQKRPVPSTGYLTQVHAWLLPRLLPPDQPATYGFYWYHPDRKVVTFREEQVTPAITGFELMSRPSANEFPQTLHCDADGLITQHDVAPGILLVPADPKVIKRLWIGR